MLPLYDGLFHLCCHILNIKMSCDNVVFLENLVVICERVGVEGWVNGCSNMVGLVSPGLASAYPVVELAAPLT